MRKYQIQYIFYVPNVIITIAQELAENVDSHDSQPAIRLNLQNSQDCLV